MLLLLFYCSSCVRPPRLFLF